MSKVLCLRVSFVKNTDIHEFVCNLCFISENVTAYLCSTCRTTCRSASTSDWGKTTMYRNIFFARASYIWCALFRVSADFCLGLIIIIIASYCAIVFHAHAHTRNTRLLIIRSDDVWHSSCSSWHGAAAVPARGARECDVMLLVQHIRYNNILLYKLTLLNFLCIYWYQGYCFVIHNKVEVIQCLEADGVCLLSLSSCSCSESQLMLSWPSLCTFF